MFHKLIPTLTKKESSALKEYMRAQKAPAGKVIMEMGDQSRDIYFLIDGNYDIYQRIIVSHQPIVLHLASLQGPELLGEANLFLDEERQATILATSECKYFLLTHPNIEKLKNEHPIIAVKIMEYAGQIVTQRLRSVQKNIYGRLIENAETPQIALQKMNTYIGPTRSCSLDLAQKLFPKETSKANQIKTVNYSNSRKNDENDNEGDEL